MPDLVRCLGLITVLMGGYTSSPAASDAEPEPVRRGWALEMPEQERQNIMALLRAGRFAELDRRYNGLQQQYEQGKIDDRDLTVEYQPFYDTAPENLSFHSRWIAESPKSYPARLARGIYYRKVAAEKRGTKFVKDTPAANLMQLSQYLRLANQDLVDSLPLTSKPIISLVHLLNSSMFRGSKQESLSWLNHANRIDPLNYMVRRRYMVTLTPRWGGSYDEMRQFLNRCRDERILPEYLRVLESHIYLDQAETLVESKRKEKALPLYQKAMDLLVGIDTSERIEALKGVVTSVNPTDLEKYAYELDETLRLAPKESQIRGYRAWVRFRQGRFAEGIADYSMAAQQGDPYAQLQYSKNLYNGIPGILSPDQQKALVWAKKAAEQEYGPAKQFLEQIAVSAK